MKKIRQLLSHKQTVIKAGLAVVVILSGALVPTVIGESLVRTESSATFPYLHFLSQPSLQGLLDKLPSRQGVMGATDLAVYPSHEVMTTVFWIGEGATAENDFITNLETAWDKNAVATFGGVDAPSGDRGFTPKHNDFYFALPAIEFNADGPILAARKASYWHNESVEEGASLFKGRWIQATNVRTGDVAYAQWVDVGPNQERDYAYVFGGPGVRPQNTFGLRAGLDISPATARALGLDQEAGGESVSWRFVNAGDVPGGPWRSLPAIDPRVRW